MILNQGPLCPFYFLCLSYVDCVPLCLGSARLIEISDSAFSGIKPNEDFFVPVFGNDPFDQSLLMGRFVGPCTRHLEISAAGNVEDWYTYRAFDEPGNENLHSQYS